MSAPFYPSVTEYWEDRGGNTDADGCVALWIAVIQQALLDATSLSKNKKAVLERDRARVWLTRRSADFELIATLAGLEPEAVLEVCQRMSRFGWRVTDQWRKNLRVSPTPH
jgi:hypothetical protein